MRKKIAATTCLVAGIVALLECRLTVRAADAYTVSTIEVPGSSLTVPCGIDMVGRVTGYYEDGRVTHGFLVENGVFTKIDFPEARWTAGFGVNSTGQIVGAYGPDGFSGRH